MRARPRFAVASLLLAVFTAPARSAEFWWTGDLSNGWNSTSTNFGTIVNTNWATLHSGGTDRLALPGTSDVVRFAASGAIHLNTAIDPGGASVYGLTTEFFGSTAVSIQNGPLTIGAFGMLMDTPSTLTISSPLFTTAASYGITTANASATLLVTGNLTSPASLTKAGPGLLTLQGINTYTGGTTLAGGTLRLASATALPSGRNLTVNSGTLNLNNFNATVASLSGWSTGSIELGTATLTAGDSASTTFGGNLTGTSAKLVKQGSGTLTLSGVNSYTGLTTINNGTLKLGWSTALASGGPLTIAQGTLDLAGWDGIVDDLTFGNGALPGDRSLVNSSPASGRLTVNGNINVLGGGNPALINGSIELPYGVHTLGNSDGQYSNSYYDVVISSQIVGGFALTKTGIHYVAVNSTGNIGLIVADGVVFLTKTNAIHPLYGLRINGGLVSLSPTITQSNVVAGNYDQTIAGLYGAAGGSLELGSATLTLSNSSPYDDTFAGNISGSGGQLVLDGSAELTVSGINTYTGGTTLNTKNTLTLGSSTALPAAGNVNIKRGTLNLNGFNATIGDLTFGGGHPDGPRLLTNTFSQAGTATLNGNIHYLGGGGSSYILAKLNLSAGQHVIDYPNALGSDYIYDLVILSLIAGPGGLTKSGVNLNAVLADHSTYTGPTVITSGDLYIAANNALPTTTALTLSGTARLILGVVAQAGLTPGSYNQTIGSLSGIGIIDLSSATLTVGDSTSTIFSGSITGTGNLIKQGVGTLTLAGFNNYIGNTTITSGGKLDFARPRSTAPVLVSTLGNLSISDNAIARITPSPRTGGFQQGVLIVNSLSISGTGYLDLTNNDLILRNQSLASVRSLVATWLTSNNGLPGTSGLGSSESFYTVNGAFTTLAVYDNSIAGQTLPTFNGIAVTPSDILVKYTYLGDTNLDGLVDASDLARLLQGLNGQGSGWNFGDVNYDGVVNFTDLGRLQAALRGQGASLGNSTVVGGGVIPEPGSIGVLLAAVPLMGRRRR